MRRLALAVAAALALAACGAAKEQSPVAGRAISGASPFGRCAATGAVARDSEVEPSLGASPRASKTLIAAWQQDRFASGAALGILAAVSRDGGARWRSAPLPRLTACTGGRYARASDPVVSIGADGAAYVVTLGVRRGREGGNDVVVQRSGDGRRWSAPVLVSGSAAGLVLDKPTLLADPRRAGWAYAVWVGYMRGRGESGRNTAVLSRTTDGGRSWGPPRRIYAADTETQFHQLLALPGGVLVDCFFETSRPERGRRPRLARIAAIRTLDGGRTWSRPFTAARFRPSGVTGPQGQRIRAFGEDITAAAGADGTLYVGWFERRSRRSTIFLARSGDRGRTWSSPRVVAQGAARAFLPILAVAGDGTVGAIWYRLLPGGSGTLRAALMFASSRNGGRSWRSRRLVAFDFARAPETNGGRFLGDYQGLAGLAKGFAVAAAVGQPGGSDVRFWRTG